MTRAITGPQKLSRSALALIAAAFVAGPAMAGSPGCRAPEYRQLDFWLGNWKALDNGGKGPPVAGDEITTTLDGCVIVIMIMIMIAIVRSVFHAAETERYRGW